MVMSNAAFLHTNIFGCIFMKYCSHLNRDELLSSVPMTPYHLDLDVETQESAVEANSEGGGGGWLGGYRYTKLVDQGVDKFDHRLQS